MTAMMGKKLRYLAEEHKNDKVGTGQVRWSDLCSDVADQLEEIENEKKNGVFTVGVDPSKTPDTHHEFTVSVDFYKPMTHDRARLWLHGALAKLAEAGFEIEDN